MRRLGWPDTFAKLMIVPRATNAVDIFYVAAVCHFLMAPF